MDKKLCDICQCEFTRDDIENTKYDFDKIKICPSCIAELIDED